MDPELREEIRNLGGDQAVEAITAFLEYSAREQVSVWRNLYESEKQARLRAEERAEYAEMRIEKLEEHLFS
jgi:hypothetical protein